jgi:hypothetical protein
VAIAKTVAALSRPLASCDRFVLLLTKSMPAVGDDPAAMVETLERFQREGFLERVDG